MGLNRGPVSLFGNSITNLLGLSVCQGRPNDPKEKVTKEEEKETKEEEKETE